MHVIHLVGTVGPIYRAVLRVLERDREDGVPDLVTIVKGQGRVILMSSSLPLTRSLSATLQDTFLGVEPKATPWPWHGDAPSSLAVVWL